MIAGVQLIIAGLALTVSQSVLKEREHEGDWFVSDSTNNNTGEREVYAFQSYIKTDNYVTLKMLCSRGKPTFFVEWDGQEFPDQVVLSIGPRPSMAVAPREQQYVFAKSDDVIERGLRASPETSTQIVAAITGAKFTTVTAHLASGRRTVDMDIEGAAGAWRRVSRHCPVAIVPVPPL